MFIARSVLEENHDLLILGLSAENRRRLAAGNPIALARETHGLAIPAKLKILIFAGEDENEMRLMMDQFIGPTTVLDQLKEQ